MKKLLILITFYLLNQFNTTVCGQTTLNTDSLICQEWKLNFYEADGEKFPPADDQRNNKMIFYNDRKVKSIESDKIQNGVWKYNPTGKILTVTDNSTNEISKLKIISISLKELILEFKDPEGTILKMYLEAISKK